MVKELTKDRWDRIEIPETDLYILGNVMITKPA